MSSGPADLIVKSLGIESGDAFAGLAPRHVVVNPWGLFSALEESSDNSSSSEPDGVRIPSIRIQILEFLKASQRSLSNAYDDYLDAKGGLSRGVIEQAIRNPTEICGAGEAVGGIGGVGGYRASSIPRGFLQTDSQIKEVFNTEKSGMSEKVKSIDDLVPNELVVYRKRKGMLLSEGEKEDTEKERDDLFGLARVSHKGLGHKSKYMIGRTHLPTSIGHESFIDKFLKKEFEMKSSSNSSHDSSSDTVYLYPLQLNNCLQITQNPDLDRIPVRIEDIKHYNGILKFINKLEKNRIFIKEI